MTLHPSSHLDDRHAPAPVLSIAIPLRLVGALVALACLLALVALATWSVDDPSFSYATDKVAENWLGFAGAAYADFAFQFLGLAALLMLVPPLAWSLSLIQRTSPAYMGPRLAGWLLGTVIATGFFACFPVPQSWPLPLGLGGFVGSGFTHLFAMIMGHAPEGFGAILYAALLAVPALGLIWLSARTRPPLEAERSVPATARTAAQGRKPNARAVPNPAPTEDEDDRVGLGEVVLGYLAHTGFVLKGFIKRLLSGRKTEADPRASWQNTDFEPQLDRAIAPPRAISRAPVRGFDEDFEAEDDFEDVSGESVALEDDDDDIARLIVEENRVPFQRVTAPAPRPAPSRRNMREAQASLLPDDGFALPPLDLLALPRTNQISPEHHPDALEANAKVLEGVLEDFGVKGDIINVRPGPVVTLYELEPAPGIKSSRVISLADDIARSMSAISARVAVVPGRNAIGIELPNKTRETVYLRELLASADYDKAKAKLPI